MPKLLFVLMLALAAQAAAAATTAPPPGTPTSKRAAAAAWTEDGLQKTTIKGIDVAYARPDASLAPYDKVLLRPVTVSFRRNWGRSSTATGGRVRSEDAQRIRERLAVLLREEAAKVLTEGGYRVVDQPGEDVLEVQASIIDLFLVAPDVASTGTTRVYALSAGSMTLVGELRDSASGEVLLRVYDHAEGRDSGRMRHISVSENAFEARRIAQDWAMRLRQQLDAARKAPPH